VTSSPSELPCLIEYGTRSQEHTEALLEAMRHVRFGHTFAQAI
jgi:hypothetical protein